MLPSTFLNGRSKLEAHCPYCDHVLPTSNARNFAIQLVGGTKSGKTTFLASFLHEYREEIKKNKRIGVKLHPETEFDEMERWYSQGFAESTSAMNANTYSIVHTWKRSQFSHQFSIYDIAGEVFSSESASRKQEQYRYCEGLIVVADPFSSRSVRLLYENKHEGKSPLNFSPMDMQDVVDGFINEFSRIGVLSTGKMSDKPVSVIISKADVDVVKHEIGYDKINSVFQANSQKYKSKDDARDAICRDYLCQIGMAGVVNNLAAQFSKIHYFPVSAMGHEDDKSAYDPWGIMEPVMWIIKKKDQRLLDILEPGKKLIKDVVRGIAAAAIISLILIGGINFYTAHKEFISRKNAAIHEYVSGKMGGLYSITVGKIAENIKRAVEERAIKAVEEKTDSVFIQSGTFTMGSPASEEGRKRDEIQHEVTVSSFYMGKHEVTQQEYQRLMGNNPSRNKGDYLPVEQISWYDAVAYCNAKSLAEGLTPAYMINGKDITWDKSADGYRLPTEAEWEYACRAGSTTAYSFGANITSSQAKHGANSGGSVTVGSYMPNAKGLYDMHGNVWEWCWDRYGDYPGEAQTGPSGPSSGANRVNRGGGWASKEGYILRSANRDFDSPDHQSAYLGFRVARTYGIASVAVTPASSFVSIPGGTFAMGSPDSETGRDKDEGPVHRVTLSGFDMGRYEVTQKEYKALMGKNPSLFKAMPILSSNRPVESVTWYDAVAFCNAKSLAEGLTPAYTINGEDVTWDKSADGYRLPTEAEWEYACRAGTTTAYNSGSRIGSAKYGETKGGPVNVGSYAPNAWGLYDMHGNVYEWCWDWMGDYSSRAQTDPAGSLSGSTRVRRSGSWNASGQYLRSANRGAYSPSDQDGGIGFRLVRSAK
ncbi:hypothetical protein AGMMS50293_03260 [Spirochaetia bacterium]|nr:hypothetical protein AGMMS50293_03260 [Spirochaetia bacterium]